MKERRMMIFRVGQDTMFQLLNGRDFCKYSFESLPEDAVLRDVYHKWEEACFMFRFEHPSFPVCEEGAQAAMSFEGVTITLLPKKPPLGPTPEWVKETYSQGPAGTTRHHVEITGLGRGEEYAPEWATQATSKWFLDTQDWAVGFDPDSDEEYQKEVLRKHIEAG